MKVISPSLQTHLGNPVTTLATLWKVKRTDGVIIGFTDHDKDIVYDANDSDGAITYSAVTGFTPSATETGSELGTDNLEVTAFLEVDAISEVDLRAGLYNFSTVEIRLVNYADLSQGDLKLRKGTVGEVTVQNGIGRFEIRGLSFRYGVTIGKTYGPICRAELGDNQCKVDLSQLQQSGSIATVIDRRTFQPAPGLVGAGEVVDNRVTGPTFPGSVSEPSELPGGDGSDHWSGENNAKTNDGSFATSVGSTPGYLRAYNFGFNIPLNALIKGIKVTIRRKRTSGTPLHDASVLLVRNGQGVGQDKADTVTNIPTTNTDKDYGGSTDLWQMSWSPKDVNDPDFGVQIKFDGNNAAIDSFSITIYWQLVKSGYFSDGIIKFTSGANNGLSMEVRAWDGTTIYLFEGMPFDLQVGDTFLIEPGCNLTINDCANKFALVPLIGGGTTASAANGGNIVNFRGEPFIPGMDQILNYPNADGSVP